MGSCYFMEKAIKEDIKEDLYLFYIIMSFADIFLFPLIILFCQAAVFFVCCAVVVTEKCIVYCINKIFGQEIIEIKLKNNYYFIN